MTLPRRTRGGDRPPLQLVPADAKPVHGLVPPHDLDAEAAVLSACMLSAAAIDMVLDVLSPEHFYSDANGRIYEAIQLLAKDGRKVDVVMVASYLRDNERLPQVGGSSYIAQLADATPAVAHVREHAMVVREHARRRLVIATLQACASIGYGPDGRSDPLYCDKVAALVATAAVAGARTVAVSLNVAMKQAMARVRDQANADGPVVGLPTGYPGIDRLTGGLHEGEMTLLGAPKKTGKSSLARGIAVHVAKTPRLIAVQVSPAGEEPPVLESRHQAQGVGVFTLEMTHEEIALELACTWAQVDGNRLKGKTAEPAEYTRLLGAASWLETLPIEFVGNRRLTLLELRGQIRVIKADFERRGIKLGLVVVDHLQLLAANEPKSNNNELDEQVLDRVARDLGQCAIDFDVPMLVLVQLNKQGGTRGSEAVEQHAQNKWRLKVHSEKPAVGYEKGLSTTPLEAELYIELQRHGPQQVAAPLWFKPAYTLFEEDGGA